jgi:hypothetical protein
MSVEGDEISAEDRRGLGPLGRFKSPNRAVAVATAVFAGALIPWIVLLALTLPPRYDAGHWRILWVGYDVAEVLVLGFAAWASWFRRQILIPISLVAAVLLFCDAWFDIVTSWGRRDQWVTLATGLGAEIPLGLFFLWLCRLLVLRSIRAFHQALDDGVATPHLLAQTFLFLPVRPRAAPPLSESSDDAEGIGGNVGD